MTAETPDDARCGKRTCHGAAALRSPDGFAPCTRPPGHRGRCDAGESGPPPRDPSDSSHGGPTLDGRHPLGTGGYRRYAAPAP